MRSWLDVGCIILMSVWMIIVVVLCIILAAIAMGM